MITYRKNVKELWDEKLFETIEIQQNGTKKTMRICEQETMPDGLSLREIRVLTATGHQTAIVTTNKVITAGEVALNMFSRWSQENYFKYMIANYDFDKMVSYGVETIDENKEVVNPPHRLIRYQIKKAKEKKKRLEAQFYPLLEQAIDTKLEEMPALTNRQKAIKEKIDAFDEQIRNLQTEAKAIPARIKLKDMPQSGRYNKLKTESKMLMNIIKMICYRAETAVANLAAPYIAKDEDEKRKFIQQIIDSPADMNPDHQQKILTITLYSLSANRYNTALAELIKLINQTETIFPGTDLTLFFKMHSSSLRTGQEF
jgi:polyhydroxyalkanoate synthesis regulator phasin